MTLNGKISQLQCNTPAISHLNIPVSNRWNECFYGVAKAGLAKVFCQTIGLAACWNDYLLHQVTSSISNKARAKHHTFARRGFWQINIGLAFCSPGIVRGSCLERGQQTNGGKPFFKSAKAETFIKGLQGDNSNLAMPYTLVIISTRHLTARESLVSLINNFLYSNKKALLSFEKKLKSVAVIGTNANDYWTKMANYHGTPGAMTKPHDGIKTTGSPKNKIHVVKGCVIVDRIPKLRHVGIEYLIPFNGSVFGLSAEYFNNKDFKYKPLTSPVDSAVNFLWRNDAPVNSKMADGFSLRWTGKITAPDTRTNSKDCWQRVA